MSKELEMLRNGLAQFGRGAGVLGFDVADLRLILARLEAAERVCESAKWLGFNQATGEIVGNGCALNAALRAYMAGVEAGKDAMRAEVDKLRKELAEARRFIKRIAGQPTTEKVRSEAVGNGEATGLEDDEQLGDYPAAYDGMILDARAFLARKETQ